MRFDQGITFRSYGLIIRLESDSADMLAEMYAATAKALLGNIEILENETPHEHYFAFEACGDGSISYFEGPELLTKAPKIDSALELFIRVLRFRVSEFAPDLVFLHAGVVAWKNRAIVIPANSGQGKTTLVVELVKLGAEYYSDEYAVIDKDGLVHPFARDLSVRTGGRIWSEKDGIPVSEFGGTPGSQPIPVGLVVFTEFAERAAWRPEEISVGLGIMEALLHTIPLRVNTKFSLNVLKNAFSRAIITKSARGEASAAAIDILSYFETQSR